MKKLPIYLLALPLMYLASCTHSGKEATEQVDSLAIANQFVKQNRVTVPGVYGPRWGTMANWSQYMRKDTANSEITNYINFVFNARPDIEVRSFFINADTLRNYLNKNRNVTDIQVFGALNTIGGTLRREYIFIGVDSATKKHVYIKDANGNDCVFENCLPCPSFCDRVGSNGGNYTLE